MAGKDFEQQVREGLQDWTMAPADQVRSAVLERVGRQRRRRALLWVPLGLLLLGLFVGGAFWLTSVRSRQTAAQGASAAATAPARGSVAAVDSSVAGRRPGDGGASGSAAAGGPTRESATGHGTSGVAESATGIRHRRRALGLAEVGSRGDLSRATVYERNTGTAAHSWATGSAATDGPAAVAGVVSAPDLYLSFSSGYLFPSPPESGAPVRIFPPLRPAPVGTDSHAGHTAAPLGNKGGLQVYVAAGASAQGSFLRFHTPAHISRFSAATSLGLGNNSGQSGDTLANSVSRPGITVGVSWLWRLSEHWGAGLGLEFDSWETVFSPVQENGSYSAPGVASVSTYGYYTAGYGSSVTNRYRLLQLPVDISWHIAPRRAWNPTLYLGLSPSYLLAGKGLVYISDGSGYEKDASLYRHCSLSGVSGFRADVVHVGKYVLQAGPTLQYGLSNVQKSAPVADHLNYVGVTLGVFRPWK
jgi:hypothetical protein